MVEHRLVGEVPTVIDFNTARPFDYSWDPLALILEAYLILHAPIDDAADQMPTDSFEPHHLHLLNWCVVGDRRVDLDSWQQHLKFNVSDSCFPDP